MLLFMLKAGARPQEVLNLNWSDVDWLRKRVFIKTIKNGKPRFVPIKDDLLGRFRDLYVLASGEKIFGIGRKQFFVIWSRYRRLSEIKKPLHSLRHTFAVNVYRKSQFNLKVVQNILGHRHLTTTAIYLDLEGDDDEFREVVD